MSVTYFTAHQPLPSLCRAPMARAVHSVPHSTSAVASKQQALLDASEKILSSLGALPMSVARRIGEFASFDRAADSELKSHGLWQCWTLTFAMPKLTKALLIDLERDGEPYVLETIQRKFSESKWKAHAQTHHLLDIALQSVMIQPSVSLLRCITKDSLPTDNMHRYLRRVVDIDLTWNRGEPIMLSRWLEVAGDSAYWMGSANSVIQRAVTEPFAAPPSQMMINLLIQDERCYPSLEWLLSAIQLDAKLSHGRRDRVDLFQRSLVVPVSAVASSEDHTKKKKSKLDEWMVQSTVVDALHDLNLCQSPRYYYRALVRNTRWPKAVCHVIDCLLAPLELPIDRSFHAIVFESFNRWGICPYRIDDDQMMVRPWASEKCIPAYTIQKLTALDCELDEDDDDRDDDSTTTATLNPTAIDKSISSRRRNRRRRRRDDSSSGMVYLAGALMSDAGEKARRLRSALIRLTLPPKKNPHYRSVIFHGDSLLHSALNCDLELGGGVWHTVLELCKAIDSAPVWNDLCTTAFDSEGFLPIHRALMHGSPLPLVLLRMLLPNRVLPEELDGSLVTMMKEDCRDLAITQDLESGHRIQTRVMLLNELRNYLEDTTWRSKIRTSPVDFARDCVRKGMRKHEIESWLLAEGVTVDRMSLSVRTAFRTSWNSFSV